MKVISSQTWCITRTGERVPEGHPLSSFLLVSKGCEIEETELERYPLVEEDESDDVTEIVEGQPVKRPRGRPRKLPITE
jgi:hypothetical protein